MLSVLRNIPCFSLHFSNLFCNLNLQCSYSPCGEYALPLMFLNSFTFKFVSYYCFRLLSTFHCICSIYPHARMLNAILKEGFLKAGSGEVSFVAPCHCGAGLFSALLVRCPPRLAQVSGRVRASMLEGLFSSSSSELML